MLEIEGKREMKEKKIEGLTLDETLEKYESLVCKFANSCYRKKKDYLDKFMDYEDVLQASYIGLMKAFERYEDGKGANFMTFAYMVIPQQIKRELFTHKRMSWLKNMGSVTSLDKKVFHDDDVTVADLLVSEEDFNIEDIVCSDIQKKLFNRLSKDDRNILVWYNVDGFTLEDIGNRIGVTRERVRQILMDITSRLNAQYMREMKKYE